jgi:hypothetical protein
VPKKRGKRATAQALAHHHLVRRDFHRHLCAIKDA